MFIFSFTKNWYILSILWALSFIYANDKQIKIYASRLDTQNKNTLTSCANVKIDYTSNYTYLAWPYLYIHYICFSVLVFSLYIAQVRPL